MPIRGIRLASELARIASRVAGDREAEQRARKELCKQYQGYDIAMFDGMCELLRRTNNGRQPQ